MIRTVRIYMPEQVALASVTRDFPTLSFISIHREAPNHEHVISAERWLTESPHGVHHFEAVVDASAHLGVVGVCATSARLAEEAAWEVLTRFQHRIGRRNQASRGWRFDALLQRHAELYASSTPLVVADRLHAVDTWQWLLRLRPDAGVELQVASLFHDIGRLEVAPGDGAFEHAHARRSAEITHSVLQELKFPVEWVERTCALLAAHESPSDDEDVRVLNDADALSFFSLNSSGYADCFGADQTRRKIAYTLDRLHRSRWRVLDRVRLRTDVRELLNRVRGVVPEAAVAGGTA